VQNIAQQKIELVNLKVQLGKSRQKFKDTVGKRELHTGNSRFSVFLT